MPEISVFSKAKLYIDRKLSRREQIIVYGAAAILLLLLFYQIVIAPIFDMRSRMHRQLIAKTAALQEIRELRQTYSDLKMKTEMSNRWVADREKGFTLFSFLDTLSGTAGVKENISYMKPTTTNQPNSDLKKSTVEMKLQGVSMEQLTQFLHGIETSRNMVFVKRLSITKKGKDQGAVNVVLQVETFET